MSTTLVILVVPHLTFVSWRDAFLILTIILVNIILSLITPYAVTEVTQITVLHTNLLFFVFLRATAHLQTAHHHRVKQNQRWSRDQERLKCIEDKLRRELHCLKVTNRET